MKTGKRFLLFLITFTMIVGVLSSCFIQKEAIQQAILFLRSIPFANIALRVNGTEIRTNNQRSFDRNTNIALVAVSPQLFDRSAHIAGNDTRLTFDRWASGQTNASINFALTDSATYTAEFSVEYYVAGQLVTSSLRETLPVSGYYIEGSVLNLEPPIVPGSAFSHWSVNGTNIGSANPLPLVINEPKMVQAVYNFQPLPPNTFEIVAPTNGATQVANTPSVQLLWTASTDPQEGPIVYDVYLWENGILPDKVAEDIGETYWIANTLEASKTYHWYVAAKNNQGLTRESEHVSFTTVVLPPSVPVAVFPEDDQTDVPYLITLIWDCLGAGEYDLYFGTTIIPDLLEGGLATKQYRLPALSVGQTYYWQIVAKNQLGTTTGPIWQFTVSDEAIPPSAPYGPNPADAAIELAFDLTLTWEPPLVGTQPFLYDVYFGHAAGQGQANRQMELIETDFEATGVAITDLLPNTTYIWQVVAKNPWGVASSSVWSFTTEEGESLPTTPKDPVPAHESVGISLTPALSWTPSTNGTIRYDVYFGTAPASLTLVASGIETPAATPPALQLGTAYYWKVVAKNEIGERQGPVWSFTTTTQNTEIYLQKTAAGFLIRSEGYFPLTGLILIQLQSETIDSGDMTIAPVPTVIVTPPGEIDTFIVFDTTQVDLSGFTPANLTLATVTCSQAGVIYLVGFWCDGVPMPVNPTPITVD